jgi:hypothetical protein
MANRTLGDLAARGAAIGGVMRYPLARALSGRESEPRRPAGALIFGLDDARFAVFGYDRSALDRAGQPRFPL